MVSDTTTASVEMERREYREMESKRVRKMRREGQGQQREIADREGIKRDEETQNSALCQRSNCVSIIVHAAQ